LHNLFAIPYAVHASGEPTLCDQRCGRTAGRHGRRVHGLSDDIEAVYYNPPGWEIAPFRVCHDVSNSPRSQTSRGFLAFNKAWDDPIFPECRLRLAAIQSKELKLTTPMSRFWGRHPLNDLLLLGVGVRPSSTSRWA